MGLGNREGILGVGIAFTARRDSRGAAGIGEFRSSAERLVPVKDSERSRRATSGAIGASILPWCWLPAASEKAIREGFPFSSGSSERIGALGPSLPSNATSPMLFSRPSWPLVSIRRGGCTPRTIGPLLGRKRCESFEFPAAP